MGGGLSLNAVPPGHCAKPAERERTTSVDTAGRFVSQECQIEGQSASVNAFHPVASAPRGALYAARRVPGKKGIRKGTSKNGY